MARGEAAVAGRHSRQQQGQYRQLRRAGLAGLRRERSRGAAGFLPRQARSRDRGAGIVPSALEHIFHPFTRRGAAGKRMGLGLAISHSIVVAHAGTLTVKSVLGGGSTFRVELPSVPPRA